MNENDKKHIEALACGIECPKDFQCVQCGVDALCNAKDVGLDSYLICLEDNPEDCPFVVSLPFVSAPGSCGTDYFCQCPLRMHLAKNAARLEHSTAWSAVSSNQGKKTDSVSKTIPMTKHQVIDLLGTPEDTLLGAIGTEYMVYQGRGICVRLDNGKVHSYGFLQNSVDNSAENPAILGLALD